jgi:hypothetical protein
MAKERRREAPRGKRGAATPKGEGNERLAPEHARHRAEIRRNEERDPESIELHASRAKGASLHIATSEFSSLLQASADGC